MSSPLAHHRHLSRLFGMSDTAAETRELNVRLHLPYGQRDPRNPHVAWTCIRVASKRHDGRDVECREWTKDVWTP